ncbi:hypothetical protein FRACYDRAFT_246133 [Fragilariopsis cylindrus CCMP1102]|uniref:Uncharacterized protein n=1 Tax=Fragilariopsis cylindrus CCMP1102 TaxID=635003 RepID=A0A1E7EYJ3_9STRA|nr:hypothetical protein FRACYDRAFT_246133 [Fragilariopsis cylindrus CCMP1102]|eukprot:OEU11031.1 hypothetical protein FRACYDRAFT_246133 [Fragilariopsis cylindrus CCMP1102]
MNNQPPRGSNDGSPHCQQQQQQRGGDGGGGNNVDENPRIVDRFLLLPSLYQNEEDCNPIQQPYNTAHIDYRIAQAWISSAATSTIRDANVNTIANGNRSVNINSLRENANNNSSGSSNNNNGSNGSGGAAAAREQEQFVDEIIDDENIHRSPMMGIHDCLIDLSVGNNNDDEGGGINIRHSCGYKNNNSNNYNKNNINLDFPLPNSNSSSSSSDNDNGNNNSDSFNAVVAITPRATTNETNNNHFLWMKTNHDPYIPDEVIILSNDDDIADRNSVHDELLTGDGDVDVDGRHHIQYHEQGGDSPPGGIEDEEKLIFRPPTLIERPKAISYGDRVTTPTNSWQSSTKNALLSIRHRPSPISMRTRTRSGSNSYSVPMSPASKHSRKSTKSEKYYHSYVTDPTTPQRPVPPFVVIHNRGHAIVKVTSKGTTTVVKSKSKLRSKSKSPSKDSNNNEGDKCECSPKPWCHQWGRSVAISLTVATLILALVTVASSLVADQQENGQQQQQQTNPTISPSTADMIL